MRLVLFLRRCIFVLVPYIIVKDKGQLSFNVSFDLQNKLSSSKKIQKDVPQVKIYIPLQNHQDNPVTIEKKYPGKNLANSYLEKAQPFAASCSKAL